MPAPSANEDTVARPKAAPALAGLALALFFGLAPLARWIAPGTQMRSMLVREAVWWASAAVILAWLRMGEGLPLGSIGVRRPTWKSAAFGLLVAFAIVAAMGVYYARVVPRLHLDASVVMAQQQAILRMPYWFRVLLVLRAAVVEEILFRGYLMEKIRQLTGSMALAALVSVSAFSYAHLAGWGAVQLVPVAASGLVLALVYAWRRDLPSNILGHFLADALGFLTR
jgi:uncharacterized protein